MANDRMYIRCKGCGEVLLLAKWWGDKWQSCTSERLTSMFYEKHTKCGFEHGIADGMKNQQFEITYESQEDEEMWRLLAPLLVDVEVRAEEHDG